MHKLGKDINNLPGKPQVHWVRPLTRRLQRLFGWGDVSPTRADVVHATKSGDIEELRALTPQAAEVIEDVDVSVAPDL